MEGLVERGTYYIGSDRYAFELVRQTSPKRAVVVLKGQEGREIEITKRKGGEWREKGVRVGYYLFGEAETRIDPNF